MKEIIKIKETCLYIKDLEGAKDFYHIKLGLEIIHYAQNRHIFFRAGSSVLLCFNPDDSKHKDSPPPHFAEGNQHYAFEVSQKDYDAVKEKIKALGITIIDKLVWKTGQESFYFNDPEGNVLEFVPEGVWG
ncbi:VOC family protein [Fulvivirga sp. 29W222]|uniref:VOC family protein n=1 Tax=Fulvivirga marina TaxID=2494733 RepID=A0A937FZM5_9BACT|nr:VOC family protein [Fulvivirga marina]MBL6447413.1 VOC family protein [Fulvivirga marina]